MATRRSLDLQSFEELAREVRKLRDRGYVKAGDWSLAQNCDHLRLCISYSLNGFPFKLPLPMRLVGPLLKWRVLSTRKLPTGVKIPAALMPSGMKDISQPDEAAADIDAANRLLETIERYQAYEGDPQPSPLFGRLDRATWDQIHLIHASHHLSFLIPNARETKEQRKKAGKR